MSSVTDTYESATIEDQFTEFIGLYYKDEAYELARLFPKEKRSLNISWSDLNKFSPDLADDLINCPERIIPAFERGLQNFDNALDCSYTSEEFGNANIRVTLPDSKTHTVSDLRARHQGDYLGVRGKMARITDPNERARSLAFECNRCGTITTIPQSDQDYQEPHECQGCERKGPFQIRFDHEGSSLVDQAKVLLKEPPDESRSKTGQGSELTVYVDEDLLEYGGEYGLPGRVGEDVVIFGTVELVQKTNGNSKTPTFDRYLIAEAIEFEDGEDEIDVDEHREEFERYAAMDDPYETFANSIAPEIKATPAWKKAELMGTAYLFGSPRIDPDNGPTYRGDIHMAIFGDPGMAKSVFLRSIDEVSPDSMRRSATGLASDVGLTAAAVKDDFGEGQYTLKPGILVQAGAHTIIDEIDKGPADLERINDALEGDQMITVSKGGIHASLKTRTGLLVSGNPEHGRFDQNIPIAEQIDVDPTLLSRFDGIITLRDTVDEDQDRAVGGHILRSYREAAAMEKHSRGENVTHDIEQDATKRDVPLEVMRAWVKYARDNIFPEIPEDVEERLRDFYVDVRTENLDMDADTIPATARKLEAGIRYACSFARLRLSETVEMQDAEKAIELSKLIIGETYDAETGTFNADQTNEAQPKTQKDKIDRVRAALPEPGDDPMSASEIAGKTTMQFESVEHYLDKLKKQGAIVEPKQGRYRKV